VVRGHTDGRPFRSETYDNWRLSTARAQIPRTRISMRRFSAAFGSAVLRGARSA
jgi:hypothetical protein